VTRALAWILLAAILALPFYVAFRLGQAFA